MVIGMDRGLDRGLDGGRAGWREGGWEGGLDGEREGGRQGWMEGGMSGGCLLNPSPSVASLRPVACTGGAGGQLAVSRSVDASLPLPSAHSVARTRRESPAKVSDIPRSSLSLSLSPALPLLFSAPPSTSFSLSLPPSF